jgi:hypothetical protein
MNDNDFGLFNTVIGGPAAAPYTVGWALLLVGTLWSLLVEQLKATRGERAEHSSVIAQALVAAIALGSFTFVSRAVWWAAQTLAHEIYPDSKMDAFRKLLTLSALRFRDFSFSLTSIGTGLRDGLVMIVGMQAWLLAFLAHWQLQKVQACVYNVIFCFGPILLGLSAFGLPTARVWLTALIEVSSWSITAAVVYYGVDSSLTQYLNVDANEQGILSTRFLDVVNNLIYLSSIMVIVPVVTGRLLGMSALGELSGAVLGNNAISRLASVVRSFQPEGPQMAPGQGSHGPPSAPSSNSHRPGD